MTPRERVLAVLDRKPVDRLPVDLWHTAEVGEALQRHCGTKDDLSTYRALGLDKIVWVFVDYPSLEGGKSGSQVGAQASAGRTMWGVPLRPVQAGESHYQEFASAPLADYDTPESLDDYAYWPDPDRFLYDQAAEAARCAARDFRVIGPWVSCFEIYCQLRGLEQALCDLVTNPDLVEAVLDRVESIQTEMMTRHFSQSADLIDLVFISDDMAGQTGLLMSPDMWARHLRPRLIRWVELIHTHGLRVFFHTDGAAGDLVEPIVECGIDVLNPIQHACPGMEMAPLKKRFGDRIIFHGGVDNQSALPFGTPDDVRAETRHCLETLGAGNEGFICCSCHNVQAGTPVENILAMIETVQASA